MISPYQTLGVPEQASDADIKQAYLQRVKDNPPDRDPRRFRAIQDAYELIKDEDSRLRHALFGLPSVEFDALLARAFAPADAGRALVAEDFRKLLSTLSIEKLLGHFPDTSI